MAKLSWYSIFAILLKFTNSFHIDSNAITSGITTRNNSQYNVNGESVIVPRDSGGKTKCLKMVPTILLEFDRRYKIISPAGRDGEHDGPNAYFSKIAVCCNGYKLHPYEYDLCVPDCGDKCHNGFCHERGDCECYPGYVQNERDQCVLSCPVGCQNGRCKRDGKCECNPGYEMGPTLDYCVPKCEKCGANQYCAEPDVCKCREGYHLKDRGCVPVCNPDCFLGDCIRPNQCKCKDYRPRTNHENKENPGENLVLRHGICQHICYQICENGRCISPHRCICNEGFVYDELTTTCIPNLENRKTFRFE